MKKSIFPAFILALSMAAATASAQSVTSASAPSAGQAATECCTPTSCAPAGGCAAQECVPSECKNAACVPVKCRPGKGPAACFADLGLSSDQQKQLQALNTEMSARKPGSDPKTARQEYLKKIKKILTPQQYTLFLEKMASPKGRGDVRGDLRRRSHKGHKGHKGHKAYNASCIECCDSASPATCGSAPL